MKSIIKLQNENNRITVSARELHEFLEIDSNFTTWFKRMCEYGFEKEKDFIPFLEESNGGRPSTDYQLTIEMAKEISMIQRSAKGKQARQYFIKCEIDLRNTQPTLPSTPMEVMKLMFDAMTDTNKNVEDLQKRVEVIESNATMSWREQALMRVDESCVKLNMLPMNYLGRIYKEVEKQARCNLELRLQNLKNRHRKAGGTVRECKALKKIDVVSLDKDLVRIFESCVNEWK